MLPPSLPAAPVPRPSIAGRLLAWLSGLGLATALLVVLGLLTWLATLEQIDSGLHHTLRKYFDWRAWYLIPEIGGRRVPLPLPGGYWVCALLAVNLVLGGVLRWRRDWQRVGVWISHLGIIYLLVAGGVAWEGHRRFIAPGPLAQPATVIIPKGAGTDLIAQILDGTGVISTPWVFTMGARLRHASLKAGEFAFPARVSPEEVVRILSEGKVVMHKLTVAEGLTVRQVKEVVAEADFLSGPVTRKVAEGWLLPETWHMTRDESRDDVLARMEKAMRQTVEVLWVARAPGLPLKSKEEAVILASMVERETALEAERPRVAAVFYNRLAKHMRLQSDPTVIYGLSDGLGELDHPLTHADLLSRHPWNTYVIDGLPQTPIANPGRASLEAVLHPARSEELYFVANGSGGHTFARTLDEHNANVARWRKIEKAGRGD